MSFAVELNDQSSIANLYKYINEGTLRNKTIIIDCSSLQRITPSSVLLIVMFVIFHKHRECSLFLKKPKNEVIKSYLRDIRLREFCKDNYIQSQELRPIENVTSFPIWRLDKTYLLEYVTKISQYFKSLRPDKDFTMLEQAIAELVNNVYDHSKSDFGAYIFTEYSTEKNIIETTIADLGVGIPFAVNFFLCQKGMEELDDKECLLKALALNFSTQSFPYNKGKGLDTVNSFIKSIKGTLKIYSGNAFYDLKEGKVKINKNPINYFKGTLVNLRIDVDKLTNIDLEDNFNELW